MALYHPPPQTWIKERLLQVDDIVKTFMTDIYYVISNR